MHACNSSLISNLVSAREFYYFFFQSEVTALKRTSVNESVSKSRRKKTKKIDISLTKLAATNVLFYHSNGKDEEGICPYKRRLRGERTCPIWKFSKTGVVPPTLLKHNIYILLDVCPFISQIDFCYPVIDCALPPSPLNFKKSAPQQNAQGFDPWGLHFKT